jgi:hypothetical protein
MTQQIVCDDCGKPIDQAEPYYEVSGVLVQMAGDPPALTTVEPSKTMHYHQDHLAQSVLEPAQSPEEPPVEPPDPDAPHADNTLPGDLPEEPPVEPVFTEDISAMTIQQALAWADDDQAKLEYALEQEKAGQNRRSLVDQLQNKLDALTP